MSTVAIVSAVILGALGIVGSIIPGLPGPPLSWAGMLLMYFWGGTDSSGTGMTASTLFLWLGITVLVTIVDYLVPSLFTRLTGGSKYAGRGAVAGLLVGMLVPPVGILAGTLAGAFLAELIFGGQKAGRSLVSSLGAFAGFLAGTGLKLVASGMMLYYIIVYI